MKRTATAFILGIVMLSEIAYLMGSHAYALAAMPDEPPAPIATPTLPIVILPTVPAEPTPRMTPPPQTETPAPTPTPHWAHAVDDYDMDDFNHLAMYCHSSIPESATLITGVVSCEVVQNRTVNKGFRDRVRYVLISGDFGGYSPRSKFYKEDRIIADIVMRSWSLAQAGDYTYRYTPRTGVYLSYSADGRYCKVYDLDWHIVCDTSQFD